MGFMYSSRESSPPRDRTQACCITGRFFTTEPPGKPTKAISSVQFSCSLVSNSCDPMNRSTPGLPVHHQLPEFTQTHVHCVGEPSNHLILSRPLLLLPSIFPSIRVFSKEVLHIRWPKYWSFSFNISPSNEYLGLISFRMHWFDLLAVQGTLKSLLQYHSSKHQFFSTQPSSQSNSHIHT